VRTDTPEVREDQRVPVTKIRTVRIDSYLWRLATLVTQRRRETVSQVIKSALVAYTEQHATENERRQAREETE
jgi:hypothetical protein